jgi:hypothetical protein
MKVYGEVDVKFHTFLNSAPDGGDSEEGTPNTIG